jgi:hypothetical protein
VYAELAQDGKLVVLVETMIQIPPFLLVKATMDEYLLHVIVANLVMLKQFVRQLAYTFLT